LLLYPNEVLLAEATYAARSLRSKKDWAAQLAFNPPWDRLVDRIEAITPAQVPALIDSYNALFTSSTSENQIPLIESGYLDQVALISGDVMADLERGYASAGVSVSSSRRESSDHISVELEFLSFLCALEGEALESNDTYKALETYRHQIRFLEHHPCQWFPLLAHAISSRDDSSFYSEVVTTARAIATHDVDFLLAVVDHLNGGGNDS